MFKFLSKRTERFLKTSSRGSGFGSQYPHGGSLLLTTSSRGVNVLFRVLQIPVVHIHPFIHLDPHKLNL